MRSEVIANIFEILLYAIYKINLFAFKNPGWYNEFPFIKLRKLPQIEKFVVRFNTIVARRGF